MLKLSDLDGLKLVQLTNFANVAEVDRALENAFTQGSQGWGVRPEVAIHLALAARLRDALVIAESLSEAHNQLKAKQMELGRVRKALEKAAAENFDEAVKQHTRADKLQTELDAARAAGRGLLAEQTVLLDK